MLSSLLKNTWSFITVCNKLFWLQFNNTNNAVHLLVQNKWIIYFLISPLHSFNVWVGNLTGYQTFSKATIRWKSVSPMQSNYNNRFYNLLTRDHHIIYERWYAFKNICTNRLSWKKELTKAHKLHTPKPNDCQQKWRTTQTGH